MQAKKNSKGAATDQEKRRFWDEFKLREGQARELEAELLPLFNDLKKEYAVLMVEKAVHFIPPEGEKIVSDAEADACAVKLQEAEAAGKRLDAGLNRVDDYRGNKYWKKSDKWTLAEITRLGDKPASGAILESELTASQQAEITEQIERERIAKLSTAARIAERGNVLSALVGRAAAMRSELEILGDSQALKKSQDWLKAETDAVNVKYS
jgi:hypothetical protein